MKKLEELGISPVPWYVSRRGFDVGNYYNEIITDDYEQFTKPDAHLIAAAPELYKWLAYAVEYYKCETRSCDNCPNGKCWIVDATAALAKASGESEVRHD